MHRAIRTPLPERLALEVEQNSECTPQEHQAHVHHDSREVSIFDRPLIDELAESITPKVLIDGYRHEDGTSDWFVAVDRVG